MTLKEKIAFCSGKDNWHTKSFEKYDIPSIMFSDGPHGLRKQPSKADMLGLNESIPATCFPSASISACSWDKNLLFEEGRAIATEAGANDVSVILGPGTNIKRNPLCGRNFEYFSEDPVLAGELSASYINGAQKTGIGTSIKHFACNNQEYFRMASDSIIDERTLREIYLKPFEIAVKKAEPYSVMCSYNKINGVYSSENRWLLTDLLRGEWGFKGLVITDWGAIGEREKSFYAGCDLSMPGGSSYGEKSVLKMIKKGKFSEKYVDECVARVLSLVKKASEAKKNDFSFDKKAHHELAKKIASESAVLLKNQDSLLPLESFDEVCFIGDLAENPRVQGYGSSHINPTEVHSLTELFPDIPFARGFDADGNTSDELLNEALDLAKKSKVAIVLAALPPIIESESFDRENMKMPDGEVELIEKVSAVNENTVVVLYTGGAVECGWAEKVKSILYLGLPGQAGAEATAELLLGKKNPSGHLAESWPLKYEDCVSSSFFGSNSKMRNSEYRENIFCGYRYYDVARKNVRFAFGHGLSYTDFSLSNLEVFGDNLTLNVKNTGKTDGSCVVQIYIEKLDSKIVRAKKELKAFEKVFLEAGEEKTLSIELKEDMFAVWLDGSWKTEKGDYKIHAGTNSVEPELNAVIFRDGEDFLEISEKEKNRWSPLKSETPTRTDLKNLIERKIEDFKVTKPFTETSTFADTKEGSKLLRFILNIADFFIAKKNGRNTVEYKLAMTAINEATFRAAQVAGGIKINISKILPAIAKFY